MCVFIVQLVEHRNGIAEVTSSNPVEALIFSGLLSNCLSWKLLWHMTSKNPFLKSDCKVFSGLTCAVCSSPAFSPSFNFSEEDSEVFSLSGLKEL